MAPYGSLWKLNASFPKGRSGNSMHHSLRVALETQCIAPYGSLWKLNASLPMGRSAGRSK
ncbi:hypothetical protein [Leptospira noguchii]|uniref:hypothetical protein n=1 Tax=Leptospira noguchii TaxID=28182 RepID=UPI003D766ED9